eukprot:364915-Chlamydomonas_euryale.AAC.39
MGSQWGKNSQGHAFGVGSQWGKNSQGHAFGVLANAGETATVVEPLEEGGGTEGRTEWGAVTRQTVLAQLLIIHRVMLPTPATHILACKRPQDACCCPSPPPHTHKHKLIPSPSALPPRFSPALLLILPLSSAAYISTRTSSTPAVVRVAPAQHLPQLVAAAADGEAAAAAVAEGAAADVPAAVPRALAEPARQGSGA